MRHETVMVVGEDDLMGLEAAYPIKGLHLARESPESSLCITAPIMNRDLDRRPLGHGLLLATSIMNESGLYGLWCRWYAISQRTLADLISLERAMDHSATRPLSLDALKGIFVLVVCIQLMTLALWILYKVNRCK